MHKTEHGLLINPSSPEQNACHFSNDISGCIFVNESLYLIKISPKFVPKSPIDDNQAMV